jgi:hypothetical protein
MGDNLVPNGLSRDCKILCSKSMYPRPQRMKLTIHMRSSTAGPLTGEDGRWSAGHPA